jgi:uncharacterized membrane protein YkvA (DUF1232 family)
MNTFDINCYNNDKYSEASELFQNHYVYTFSLMIKAYVKGEYKKLPAKTLVKIVAVLLYFVSPFDFIPDLLPIIGFTDDLALLLWVANSIKTELDEFDKLHQNTRNFN